MSTSRKYRVSPNTELVADALLEWRLRVKEESEKSLSHFEQPAGGPGNECGISQVDYQSLQICALRLPNAFV